MHELSIFYHYTLTHKDALGAFTAIAGGVSTFVQIALHTTKVEGYVKSFLVSHVGAFLGALATYAVTGTNDNVGYMYLVVWFVSQFWHALAVNPFYNRYALPFLEWVQSQKEALPAPGTEPPTFG